MYPHPPPSHKPTNYYWVLVLCVGAMLVILFAGFKSFSARFNSALAGGPLVVPAPAAQPKPLASLIAQATPTVSVAPEASVAATPTPGGVVNVDAKTLTESPASYRSRVVRVRGTVFYTGKLADGKTWIQIVGGDNVYVDGQFADALPAGVAKGVEVDVTGIGAGLTNVTASNGKDYDQAYIDPIQKIEPASRP
jgi:hypothetical protein